MNHRLAALAACVAVSVIATTAAAGDWKELKSDEYQLRMEVPKEATVKTKKWPNGWAGVVATTPNVTLIGIAKKGAQAKPANIEPFVAEVTGVPIGEWKLYDKGRNKLGMTHYKIGKANKGDKVFICAYGAGPAAGYVLFLRTSKAFFNSHKPGFEKWVDSIKVW